MLSQFFLKTIFLFKKKKERKKNINSRLRQEKANLYDQIYVTQASCISAKDIFKKKEKKGGNS